jgi:hypothetical protein
MLVTHGRRNPTLRLYPGLCLVVGASAFSAQVARAYGRALSDEPAIFVGELGTAGLVIEEVEVDVRAALDGEGFPGDSASEIAEFVGRGIDAIRFEDVDPEGRAHSTVRLFSARALAALALSEVEE